MCNGQNMRVVLWLWENTFISSNNHLLPAITMAIHPSVMEYRMTIMAMILVLLLNIGFIRNKR